MYIKKAEFLSLFFAVIFIFAASAFSQTPEPTPPPIKDDPIEKVFIEEIKLNISALNKAGNFVDDLKKEDVVIVEDGRLHQPNSLRRIPANVLIVLDTGGEMRRAKSLSQTRKTAAFLVNSLKAEDSVAVLEYNDKVRFLSDWTKNKAEILNNLNEDLNFGKRSVFLDALSEAKKFMEKMPLENRHLVLITDGTDSFENDKKRLDAMNELLTTDINIHVISYTRMEKKEIAPNKSRIRKGEPKPQRVPEEIAATLPLGVRDTITAPRILSVNTDKKMINAIKKREQAIAAGENFLLRLSRDTNGEFVLPENPDEMLEKTGFVAQTIDSSYVLTYTPKRPLTESPAGEVRNIIVSSKRPGLNIQARRKLITIQDKMKMQ